MLQVGLAARAEDSSTPEAPYTPAAFRQNFQRLTLAGWTVLSLRASGWEQDEIVSAQSQSLHTVVSQQADVARLMLPEQDKRRNTLATVIAGIWLEDLIEKPATATA